MTTSDPAACIQCGLCNAIDPLHTAVRKETGSTRNKLVLAKARKTSPLFYLSTDATAQEAVCPAHINITEVLRSMREQCVNEGVTTSANEEMAANFRRTGFPYPDMKREDWHDKPVW